MADNRTIENAANGDKGATIALLKKRAKWEPERIALFGRGDPQAVSEATAFIKGLADEAAEKKADYEASKVTIAPRRADLPAVPISIVGDHEEKTIAQLRKCLDHDDAVMGAICADGHLGYSQPVGGVVAYREHISVSGVGYDIACGNLAVKTDATLGQIRNRLDTILDDISARISFGLGRKNDTRVEHALFDDRDAWLAADVPDDLRKKATEQLGTVGTGNHYVDLFREVGDDIDPHEAPIWIGIHFGSRGLGHTLATKYLKLGGGRDGIDMPPTLLHQDSDLGRGYIAAMELAGRYAYAGREWVAGQVRSILGAASLQEVHNHHNFAWKEEIAGAPAWVIRKGCTPAYPGQMGFVGGSMGDDAVILSGQQSRNAAGLLNSTVHGAGRIMGRKQAKKTFRRDEMDEWLNRQGVKLRGGDLDESPMAYRRLHEVLAHHTDTIRVHHRLRPIGVVMAGADVVDPFKD